MELQEGRDIYGEIIRRCRNISHERGSRQIVKGIMRDQAREVWKELGSPSDFESWWSEIHSLGLTPKSVHQSTKTKSTNGTKRNDGKGAYLDRYRTLALKYDTLPTDRFISDEWGCDYDTIPRIRSRLGLEGYKFNKEKDKSITVLKRPTPQPVSPPNPVVPIVAKSTPATQPEQLPLVSDAEHLGAMVHELVAMSKAQLQMQAGTYRKLGELVELFAKAWQ